MGGAGEAVDSEAGQAITTLMLKSFFRLSTTAIVVASLFAACSIDPKQAKEEHLQLQKNDQTLPDSLVANMVRMGLSIAQISTLPYQVELTGLPNHRLVTIYKKIGKQPRNRNSSFDEYGNSTGGYDDSYTEQHFMPGIDLVHGYNLVNVAHYDLQSEKLNYLFANPVLVKSLYYPSFVQDSINKKPVNRNYYLVSVYDEDTNHDTLINKVDLRRFYFFNASADKKIQLLPNNYSVLRSQYDSANDVMYLFAKNDSNANGKIDNDEPLHVFWINLKQPAEAKRLY